jgi:subtilisin-like proprotein convertase family protein
MELHTSHTAPGWRCRKSRTTQLASAASCSARTRPQAALTSGLPFRGIPRLAWLHHADYVRSVLRSSRAALAVATLAAVPALHSLGAEPAWAATFSPGGPIKVVDNASAVPYPSTVLVGGTAGTVTKVTVTLTGVTHRCPIDLDVQLVSPAGTSVVLTSDAGAPPGGGCPPASGVDLTFDDDAPTPLPDRRLESGSYRPANYAEDDPHLCGREEGGPAPALTGASALAAFGGEDPTGEWRLNVVDDCVRDAGSIAGWELEIGTTASPFVDVRPPLISDLAVVPRCLTSVHLGGGAEAKLAARYRLSEDAKVAYVIGRRIGSPGRLRCPGSSRAGRPGQYRDVGSVQEQTAGGAVRRVLGSGTRAATARAGKNAGHARRHPPVERAGPRIVSLAKALEGRRLAPGTYLVTMVAYDAAGHRSAVARAKFWVLRDD